MTTDPALPAMEIVDHVSPMLAIVRQGDWSGSKRDGGGIEWQAIEIAVHLSPMLAIVRPKPC